MQSNMEVVCNLIEGMGGSDRRTGEPDPRTGRSRQLSPWHLQAWCHVDGVEYVVSAVCPHLGGIVNRNDADNSWQCPLHGSRFSPDGTLLEVPVTADLTRGCRDIGFGDDDRNAGAKCRRAR